jgi:hypothetical protein
MDGSCIFEVCIVVLNAYILHSQTQWNGGTAQEDDRKHGEISLRQACIGAALLAFLSHFFVHISSSSSSSSCSGIRERGARLPQLAGCRV